jgi:Domain of unknown function (DUF5655)
VATGPLWTCPRCGRGFANRNQVHACRPLGALDHHLAGRPPEVVAIFWRLLELAERNGPVTVLPEKSRVALQVRMSFAAVTPRRRWVDGHVVLARRLEHPRFRRIESISPRSSSTARRRAPRRCAGCWRTAPGTRSPSQGSARATWRWCRSPAAPAACPRVSA